VVVKLARPWIESTWKNLDAGNLTYGIGLPYANADLGSMYMHLSPSLLHRFQGRFKPPCALVDEPPPVAFAQLKADLAIFSQLP
jgi:hypothetical protein